MFFRSVALNLFILRTHNYHYIPNKQYSGMRKLHCCTNLLFMFQEEADLLLRFSKAKDAGFKAVEFPIPETPEKSKIEESLISNGLETVMMNTRLCGSENGYAAIPGKEKEFLESLKVSIDYCVTLKCQRLHVLAGVVKNPTEEHDIVYEKNIREAVKRCETKDITVLIEPISKAALSDYYLHDFNKAVALIKKINSSKLKLQLDLFHLQMTRGNLTSFIQEYFSLIGHVQIAQVPSRNEPNTLGEINYTYIFDLLNKLNYSNWIGLEYRPCKDTVSGLNFIAEMGLTTDLMPESS